MFWRKYPVFYTGYVRKKNTSLVSIAQALLRMELDGVYKCDRIFLYYKMYLRQMTEQVWMKLGEETNVVSKNLTANQAIY